MADFPDLPDTRLVLICSGRQQYADPPRLQDHDDYGLSDEGHEQVDRLRHRLTVTGELNDAAALLSSAANRAVVTAEALRPAIGGGALSLESSCGFCEPHSGAADGMVIDEWLNTLAKTRVANWSPYSGKAEGGESVKVGIERAARALIETVLRHRGETIVVVTHTIPLRASLWAFLGLPFHGLVTDPVFTRTGITEWIADGWVAHTGQMRAQLVRFNDAAHLSPGMPTTG